MIVVSDASPIIALAAIGRLPLLQSPYQKIVIPEAVFTEVVRGGPRRPGAQAPLQADWITVRAVRDFTPVRDLNLGAGEKAALALVLELNADLLLVDEIKARRAAAALDIPHIGILGVLLEAKSRAFVASVRPLLRALDEEAGFRFSQELYDRVLTLAGE